MNKFGQVTLTGGRDVLNSTPNTLLEMWTSGADVYASYDAAGTSKALLMADDRFIAYTDTLKTVYLQGTAGTIVNYYMSN